MIGPFLLAATLIELTPGPNMAFLVLVAARQGRVAGLFLVLGVTLGLAACLLASVAGLAEIAAATPWVYHALRWGGAAYLAWLAWDAWRYGDPAAGGPPDPAFSAQALILRGFLINVLNPKNLAFYITVLPAFIVAERGGVAGQALVLGGLHIAVAAGIHTAIVASAGAMQAGLRDRLSSAPVRAAFALGLIGVAVWVLWTTRQG